ncbi:RNA-directed DNA polymerase (Reverse transcriptase) [Trifolium medium]|uniref:RNA-directed DNA polymerase (Reverse transcriptase) n=1 Tax=Trifolium medium TaxID=97028 RepID=A0A392MKC1_9FABA|nr:RNA-directed DNA polymerase (Reverse transcriptase) [Trifolium medium]
MQERRPIAYFSKALGVRNVTKSAYEKEFMAVVLAIQHWGPYLIGRRFIVSTDQKSLKQLLQERIVTAEQQNWAAKLLGFDFEIVYKPGRLNRGADALSRATEGGELCAVTTCLQWKDEEVLKEEFNQDPHLQKIVADLQNDVNSRLGFVYKHGVLMYEGRLVISRKSVLIPTLLKEFHATPQGGHSGFYRTYRRLASNVYWVGMKNAIQEYVRSCDVCQRQKYLASSPGGLLQPLPVPDRIWEDVSMKQSYTAKTIAEVFVKEVVRLHGIPLSIVFGDIFEVLYS